jgi:hypothetical protein
MRVVLAPLLDVMCLCLAGVSASILLTGGGRFVVVDWTLSATRARNPLTALLLLAALRSALAPDRPFLARSRGKSPTVLAARACRRLHDALMEVPPARIRYLLLVGLALSLCVKVSNARYSGGFAWADAVEIHEMTFSALDGHNRGAWDIRPAFYPMAVVYPLQRVTKAAGVQDRAVLVFVGRLAVVAFSLVNLFLVYRIGRHLFSPAVGLLAFVMLLVSRLHTRLGSTALPRTVSSTFLLASFWILVSRRGARWAALAGAALGVAASLRFGEAVFAVPFVVQLALERRHRELWAGLGGAAVAAGVVLGPGDLLFWPQMFWSLRHMVDFALVRHLSSSGYDPFWQYLVIAPAASDVVTIGLFLYSLRFRPWRPALWSVAPVLLLCVFQKKEERYLLPALAFFLLCAAVGAFALLSRVRDRSPSRVHLFTLLALSGALLLEAEGFRLRDRGNAVRIFESLAADPRVTSVTMEDGVQAGARIYLPPRIRVFDVDGRRTAEGAYLWATLRRPEVRYVVLRDATTRRRPVPDLLVTAGFHAVEVPGASPDYRLFHRDD